MSTANKLTYLNTTKGKIKDSINITGANIGANDTFRSYSTKLKDGIVDMINNGTETAYNNFPKTTDTGSDITLNDTYNSKLKVDLKGNTYQKSYSGKNLLSNNLTSQTVNGITLTKNSDGTVLVNGTATALVTVYIIGSNVLSLSPGTYTLSGCPSGGSDNTYRMDINDGASIPEVGTTVRDFGNSRTFTLSSSLTVNNVRIRIASGATINNLTFKPMIESGTTKTEYEPYTGKIPSPNPEYSQNIEVVTGRNVIDICGKNLFDKNNVEIGDGYIRSGDGQFASGDNNKCILSYLPIDVNKNYTLTYHGIQRIYFYDKNKNYLGPITTSTSPISFIPLANSKYMRISGGKNNFNLDTIQLEYGSTATEYEEFKGQSYEINLGKNLLDISDITNTDFITNNGDGSITLNGQAYGGVSFPLSKPFTLKANTTYTLSLTNTDSSYAGGTFILRNGDTNKKLIEFITSSTTWTPTEDTLIDTLRIYGSNLSFNNFTFSVQLEENDHATSYSPYKKPIEMCKISNTEYEDSFIHDLTTDKWYIHKEITKYIFDGTEGYNEVGTSDDTKLFRAMISLPLSNNSTDYYCTHFTQNSTTFSGTNIGSYIFNTEFRMRVKSSLASNLNEIRAWTSNNNVTIYYPLATPTNTEITDTELIEQLNELESANSYLGQTNITAEYISGNQPFDMSVSALLKEA